MSEERSDEFTICDQCLGQDKSLKMLKHIDASECKMCTRPFTVYRWHSNSSSLNKSKKTIICFTCARSKNCCQSCMLDINFHIPLDVRDAALKMAGLENSVRLGDMTTRNRELRAITADKQEENYRKSGDQHDQREMAMELLSKLADKLNDRQSLDTTKKSSKSLKSEDLSSNTVDISKILSKLPFGGTLEGTDTQVPSFFIFGFGDEVPQYTISNFFEKFGKVRAITVLHKAKCGFVTFTSNESAQLLIDSINSNGLNTNRNTAGLVMFDSKFPARVVRSKVRNLGTRNDENHKLSLVVNKVMSQLAERDMEASSKGTVKNVNKRSSNKKSDSKEQEKKKLKYKSASADFEL